MESDLLVFKVPQWSVIPLYLLPALINLALLVYAVLFLPNYQRNRIFCLFLFLLAATQISDGFLHMSVTAEQALFWQKISLVPMLFIVPVGIILVFAFAGAGKQIKALWFYPVLFGPALVFSVLNAAGPAGFEIKYSEVMGWIANPSHEFLTITTFGYISLGTLVMPVILWWNWKRSPKTNKHRGNLMLLFIGISIPLVGGGLAEVVFPVIFGLDNVPLAGPLMTAFPICALIAIRKYNMLSFSPHRQWENILDTISEGILIADNERKIMYINPSLCFLLGYEGDELIGKEADQLILNASLHGAHLHTDREFQMAGKSGKLTWVVAKLSSCLDENGKMIGTIWTITDIDDLKKKSIEFHRSETLLNRAQSIAKVGHWDLDFRAGRGTWSQEMCRIYGLSAEDVNQSFENWLSFVHPEDLPYVMREIQKVQNGFEDSEFEHRILLRDKTVKYVRSISKFEFDGSGSKPVGVYGVTQDITEIKSAHEQLNITTLELETYIYKSSHDLHAPLTSILGLINVGRREIKDPLAAQYLQMIEGQAKKLDAIRTDFIKAMLIKDAARFDEKVELNEMIPQILASLRNAHGFERLSINVNIPDSAPLRSNSYLIKTILQNLIENSVKYQDYSHSNAKLYIDVERSGKNATITVADNGVGIAREYHDRIFDMYFRGSEVPEGSGLGLYLVKKAVDKLNGKLHLRSNPGEGTTFTIQLAMAG